MNTLNSLHLQTVLCIILLLGMCAVIMIISKREKENYRENADSSIAGRPYSVGDDEDNFSIHTHSSDPIVNPLSSIKVGADDSGGNFSIHTHSSSPDLNEGYIYDYNDIGTETEYDSVNADEVRKCICSSRQGGRDENCQNKEVVTKLYLDGKLTEYTDLKRKGGWTTTSPGDLGFPLDTGCTGCNKGAGGRPWSNWDYTSF